MRQEIGQTRSHPALRHAAGWWTRYGAWCAASLVVAGAAICLRPALLPDPQRRLLRQAVDALVHSDFDAAERFALAVLNESPDNSLALAVAGEAVAKRGRHTEAVSYFLRVSPDSPSEYVRAQFGAGATFVIMGRARDAEACFRRAVELDPQHEQANVKLAVLLQIQGRTWEAMPYGQALIRGGRCGRDELLMVGGIDGLMIDEPHFIEECLRAVPEDPVVLVGRGRLALLRKDDAAQAESIFRRIADSKPARGPTGTVSGKVTLSGKPLPAGCTIVFTHHEKSVPAAAPIGSDGSYSLSSMVAGPQKVSSNAPAKAAAAAPDPSNPEAYKAFMMGKGAISTAEDKPSFPKRYLSPDESGLTFAVQEGPNIFDVDLKE